MINIVTNNIFESKNVHFNTKYCYLYKKKFIKCFFVFVSKINAYYVFENNKFKFEKMNIFAIIVRKKIIVAEKMKFINKNKMFTSTTTSKKSIF